MKISIITATYNSGKTVRDTIESVLAQNYTDWEHIIVDGCSKDNTVGIIREYEPQYKGRLKWISERDKGIYDAMNKGIAMATGDIIGLLNSDDFYFSPNSLSMVANGLADASVDAVYADTVVVDQNNTNKVVRHHICKDFKPSMMRYGFMPSHPTFYCRKAVYDKFGNFDLAFKSASDFDWLLRTIYVGKIKTKYQSGDFTKMRNGGTSQQGLSSYSTTLQETLKACKKNNVNSNIFFLYYKLAYKFIRKIFHKSY